jgi:hypothetical protein
LDDFVVDKFGIKEVHRGEKQRYTPLVAIDVEGMTPVKAWNVAKGQLQAEIDKVAFDTWVKNVEFISFEGGAVKLGVANDYAKQWLEDRLTKIAERVLSGIFGERVSVQFVLLYQDE